MVTLKKDEGLDPTPGYAGLRNTVPSDAFDVGDLEVATNVDILDSRDIQTRHGNGPVKDATASHSLFSFGDVCLVVQGTVLYRVNPDYSKVVLRSDMVPKRPVSYTVYPGRIYYTNGVQRGCVEDMQHRTFGLEVPALPTASFFPGTMRAGRYQFVMTYRRLDGQESGAGACGAIDVPANGGFQLTNIPVPTDSGVSEKVLYVTRANGETPYVYMSMPASQTSAFVVEERLQMKLELRTQFLGPPPDGDIVENFNGYTIIASGDTLYPSEPFAPEIFDRRKGYRMNGRVMVVACMTDGLYCHTDTDLIWLAGMTPETWAPRDLALYGGIPGSLAYVSRSSIGKGDGGDRVAFWMTERGICMGGDGSAWLNLTESRFAYPIGERGAGLVRRHQGMNQYIGVMRGIATAGNSFN